MTTPDLRSATEDERSDIAAYREALRNMEAAQNRAINVLWEMMKREAEQSGASEPPND